jgi:hypothetical protein
VLEGAFPFEHGPGLVVVLGELGEDRAEIHLPIAQRAEAAGAVHPGFVPAVDADATVRVELGVLDVEGLDALVVEVDEGDVVELLQQEVARVVVDAGARVAADRVDEALEGGAVVDVLAGWIS